MESAETKTIEIVVNGEPRRVPQGLSLDGLLRLAGDRSFARGGGTQPRDRPQDRLAGDARRTGRPSGDRVVRGRRLVATTVEPRMALLTCPSSRVQSVRSKEIHKERTAAFMFKSRKSRPEAQVPERTYSSSEVADVAGVSLRQLQWWDERKVVSPRHEGHRRVYDPAEVIEITVIAELRRKGFSLQKIRRVLRFLQREMGTPAGRGPASRLRPAPGHRRKVDLPGRSPGAHHRHPEERPPAHVPGVRERPGSPPGRIRPQAGPHGIRRPPGGPPEWASRFSTSDRDFPEMPRPAPFPKLLY